MDDQTRNDALRISIAWGPERSRPFAERLAEVRPELSAAEVEELRILGEQVSSRATDTIVSAFRTHWNKDPVANAAWEKALLRKWPWLNEANLTSMWTQGCYYAWKNGEMR